MDYKIYCVKCNRSEKLTVLPHRNAVGQMIGFLYVCQDCEPALVGCEINLEIGIPETVSPESLN